MTLKEFDSLPDIERYRLHRDDIWQLYRVCPDAARRVIKNLRENAASNPAMRKSTM